MSFAAQAQIAPAFDPFTSRFSLSFASDKTLWGDLRSHVNTDFDLMNLEVGAMVNFSRQSVTCTYAGAGVVLASAAEETPNNETLSGYFFALGTRINAFNKPDRLQLIFELSPYTNSEFTGGTLRGSLGLAYVFRKKEN